ncbi:MAG TPA: MFS transporter [Caulobacteraceae bacterium]|jgi:MFS family permease
MEQAVLKTKAGAPPVFSDGYKRLVVGFLLAAYTLNFIDRTIVGVLGQAIKVDLNLTDTQLGLLGGLAFAILYTLLGVPIARLAERWNRVSIISISIVLWSGFTAACGLAANFTSLLAMRVGVGIGEAGCSPPSHSLISDYFEPKRRASALSVYAFGIPLGATIGAIAAGALAQHLGWRAAFMIVGAPGVILAVLIKWVVREPPRGHSEPQAVHAAPQAFSMKSEFAEMASVTRALFGSWPMFNMMMGVTLVSFAGYGVGQFSAPYFNRVFGLDYQTVGLILGVIGGVSAGVGTLAGGFISDFAGKRDARWYALTPAIGLTLALPFYVGGYMLDDWKTAAVVLSLPAILAYTYLAPTFAVVQNVVETRRRATAAAVMLLFLNIIALGGGPLFAGWMIDVLGQFHFAHPGPHGFLAAVGGALSSDHGAMSFATACPGGHAPAHAAAALAAQCTAAEGLATRQGILVTIGFYAWGAIHYMLATFGLGKRLAEARTLSPASA